MLMYHTQCLSSTQKSRALVQLQEHLLSGDLTGQESSKEFEKATKFSGLIHRPVFVLILCHSQRANTFTRQKIFFFYLIDHFYFRFKVLSYIEQLKFETIGINGH